jgi:hypothetical protein
MIYPLFEFSGSTGLLTLAWYLQRQSKQHEEHEQTYKSYLGKVTDVLQDQYEKHLQNPHTQPWLTINHIRDKLIPEADRFVLILYYILFYFE